MGECHACRPYLAEDSCAVLIIMFAHRDLPDLAKALITAHETVEASKREYGDQHFQTCKACSNLADVLSDLGQEEEAAKYYELSLNIRKELVGAEHADTQQVYLRLQSVKRHLTRKSVTGSVPLSTAPALPTQISHISDDPAGVVNWEITGRSGYYSEEDAFSQEEVYSEPECDHYLK